MEQFKLFTGAGRQEGRQKKEKPRKPKKERPKHGIFENRIEHTKKEHLCARCEVLIPAGSPAVRHAEFKNGKFEKEEYFHPKNTCPRTIKEILGGQREQEFNL